jgi:hypothetical protein
MAPSAVSLVFALVTLTLGEGFLVLGLGLVVVFISLRACVVRMLNAKFFVP